MQAEEWCCETVGRRITAPSRKGWLESSCIICNNTHQMIPFHVDFAPGSPLYEQVVYAATKAIVSGRLSPGDDFPSVRVLSRELKINPNTAHKVVTRLVDAGLLEIRQGSAPVVTNRPAPSDRHTIPKHQKTRSGKCRCWKGESSPVKVCRRQSRCPFPFSGASKQKPPAFAGG